MKKSETARFIIKRVEGTGRYHFVFMAPGVRQVVGRGFGWATYDDAACEAQDYLRDYVTRGEGA